MTVVRLAGKLPPHLLERVLGVARHFGVHPLVCINKFDLNEGMDPEVASHPQHPLEVVPA